MKLNAEKKESAVLNIRKAKGLFCLAAGLSFLLSVYLWFGGSKEQGLFVGLWVPSILSLGAMMLLGREKQ
jgi:hypothetical protein